MKKKQTTVGERIMCKNEGVSVQDLRTLGVCPRSRRLASIIDSALKRAVREAHRNGCDLHNPSCSIRLAVERRMKLETKYGVKLKGPTNA